MEYPDFRQQPRRPDLAPLLARMESLGTNCELGLIQRHCSVERMGLFRFGLTPIDGLIAALNDNFASVGDPQDIAMHIGYNKEWITTSRKYGFEFHTEHSAANHSEEAVREKMSVHFKFLVRKLQEELEEGDKLFSFRPRDPVPAGEKGRLLLQAMRRFGRAPLLWVDIATDASKFGTVDWTIPGELMTGYLDRYGTINRAVGASLSIWLDIVVSSFDLLDNHLDRQANRVA